MSSITSRMHACMMQARAKLRKSGIKTCRARSCAKKPVKLCLRGAGRNPKQKPKPKLIRSLKQKPSQRARRRRLKAEAEAEEHEPDNEKENEKAGSAKQRASKDEQATNTADKEQVTRRRSNKAKDPAEAQQLKTKKSKAQDPATVQQPKTKKNTAQDPAEVQQPKTKKNKAQDPAEVQQPKTKKPKRGQSADTPKKGAGKRKQTSPEERAQREQFRASVPTLGFAKFDWYWSRSAIGVKIAKGPEKDREAILGTCNHERAIAVIKTP